VENKALENLLPSATGQANPDEPVEAYYPGTEISGFMPHRGDFATVSTYIYYMYVHIGNGYFKEVQDQVARTAPRKISTIEDTGNLKPCHNSTQKFEFHLCHLTRGPFLEIFVVYMAWPGILFAKIKLIGEYC
jgi:hypothetical protein